MGLGKRSMLMAGAQFFEMGLQILLPVVLVRTLIPEEFGAYRLAWLIVGSLASALPFAIPDTLSVLLPRHGAYARQLIVRNMLLLMGLLGCLAGLGVGLVLSLFDTQSSLNQMPWLIGVFTAVWIFAVTLDSLPLANEEPLWQAKAIIVLALIRTAVAVAAAWWFRSLWAVMLAILVTASLRAWAVIWYARRFAKNSALAAPQSAQESGKALMIEHWRVAAPLGSSSLLYTIRRQADSWVAATVFSAVQFASFSLGSVLAPIVLVVRRAVSTTLLPSMSRNQSKGDLHLVLQANHRANEVVAGVVCPALALIWWFAPYLFTLVYTETYVDAALVLRVMTFVWLAQVIELNSLLLLTGTMGYAARIGIPLTAFSFAVCWYGATRFGLLGASVGALLTAVLERALLLRGLSKALKLPLIELQPWPRLLLLLGMCFGLAGLAYGLSLYVPGPRWLVFGGTAMGYALCYYSLVRVSGLVRWRMVS